MFCLKISFDLFCSYSYGTVEYPTLGSMQEYQNWNHISESVIQTFFELWQDWCYDQYPKDLISVLDYILGEEYLANIQPEPLLMQLRAIPCSSATVIREIHTSLSLKIL